MGKAYRYAIVNMHEGKRELSQYSVVESITVFDRELSGAELDAWPDYLILDDGLGLAVGDGYDGHTWTRNIDGAQVTLPIDEPSRAVDAMLSLLHGLPVQGEEMDASQLEQVEQLRAALDIVVVDVAREGNEDTAIRGMELFRLWEPGDYRERVGEPRIFNGYPYRVYQPHDSTVNPGWTPEAAPALWTPYHGTTIETALPYRRPTGAHDMYKASEMMVWTDGGLYRCKQDTVYSPVDYAQAWERVTEGGEGSSEPEAPAVPTYAAWAQPAGGHDAYKIGDRVTYQGQVWESTANGNVWVPGVYGWIMVSTV